MRRWHAPCNPECAAVEHFFEALDADPMTAYSGVGDEVAEDFERRHMADCERCQEYGAAHLDVRG
jgi:hypothetical protein